MNEQASAASLRLSEARQAKAGAKPVEISGLAAVISMASGAGQEEIGRMIGMVKAGLFLTLIEALVWLSVPAMTLLSQAAWCKRIATPVAIELVADEVANPYPATVNVGKTASTKGGSAYYTGRLQRDFPALAAKVHDGEMSVYAASVAAGLRKPAGKKWTQPADYGIEAITV